jgi:hypothetical protein
MFTEMLSGIVTLIVFVEVCEVFKVPPVGEVVVVHGKTTERGTIRVRILMKPPNTL